MKREICLLPGNESIVELKKKMNQFSQESTNDFPLIQSDSINSNDKSNLFQTTNSIKQNSQQASFRVLNHKEKQKNNNLQVFTSINSTHCSQFSFNQNTNPDCFFGQTNLVLKQQKEYNQIQNKILEQQKEIQKETIQTYSLNKDLYTSSNTQYSNYNEDSSTSYKQTVRKPKQQTKCKLLFSEEQKILNRHERNFYPYLGVHFKKSLKNDFQFQEEINNVTNIQNPLQYIIKKVNNETLKTKLEVEQLIKQQDISVNKSLYLWVKNYLHKQMSQSQKSKNIHISNTHEKRVKAFQNRAEKFLKYLDQYI